MGPMGMLHICYKTLNPICYKSLRLAVSRDLPDVMWVVVKIMVPPMSRRDPGFWGLGFCNRLGVFEGFACCRVLRTVVVFHKRVCQWTQSDLQNYCAIMEVSD